MSDELNEQAEVCRDCHFFEESGITKGKTGYCHRYPPVVVSHRSDGEPAEWFIPDVIADEDWCGEFKPATTA